MKHFSTLILFAFCASGLFFNAQAATLTYNGSWSPNPPSSSTSADDVEITSGTVAFSDGWKMNNLTIKNGADVTFSGTGTVEVGTDFTIESNAALLISSSGNFTVGGDLTINNTGALAITGSGSISVTGTSTMSVTGANSTSQYNTWGSMFSSTAILTTMGNPNPCDIYAYDATQQEWKYDYTSGYSTTCAGNAVTFSSSDVVTDGTADGNFDVARGYFVVGDASTPTRTFSASGAPNSGTITYPIYGTSLAIVDGNDWNLIANPYPSGINVSNFLTTNSAVVGTSVYIYNSDGTWDTETSASSDVIAAGQGFFVDPNTTSDGNLGNAQFLNSHRTTTNNTFRSGNYQFAYLSLTTPNGVSDEFKVFMDLNASNGFDRVWDAQKAVNGIALHLASYIDNAKYAVNGILPLNYTESFTMDLFVEVPDAGTYTISLDSLENISNHSWEIKDKNTGLVHDLMNGEFSISVNQPETFEDRYQLIITNNDDTATSVNELNQQFCSIINAHDQLFIDGLGTNLENVTVTDLSGRLVLQQNVKATTVQISTSNLPSGIYLVSVSNQNGKTQTLKLSIQ